MVVLQPVKSDKLTNVVAHALVIGSGSEHFVASAGHDTRPRRLWLATRGRTRYRRQWPVRCGWSWNARRFIRGGWWPVLAGTLPTVTIVVPGSSAAAAGLRVGDQIASIAGATIDPELGWRSDVLCADCGHSGTAWIRRLARTGPELSVISGGHRRAVQLIVSPGCSAEFSVRPSKKLNSYSDGKILQITSAVMSFCKTDAELAAVVAHELAHNILRHPERLRAIGRSRAAVRHTEVEAERLSFYLLALAGYSLDEAFALRDRLSRKTDWGILSRRRAFRPQGDARIADRGAGAYRRSTGTGH